MKRTQLEKLNALKLVTNMKKSAVPERYAQGSTEVPDRRTQRRLERERGLVPFAVKIDRELAARLRARAQADGADLNELVGTLLERGLAERG